MCMAVLEICALSAKTQTSRNGIHIARAFVSDGWQRFQCEFVSVNNSYGHSLLPTAAGVIHFDPRPRRKIVKIASSARAHMHER